MKYAWIEETEVVNGEEILDVGDVPFDPPQYEQITQGTGNGNVTGLNRQGQEGELTGNCTPQDLIYGMDVEKYEVIDYVFTPKAQEDIDEVDLERERESALSRLWEHHDGLIASYGWTDPVKQSKKGAKLGKAQRAEAKGIATPEQEQFLDDNDAIDDWFDSIESDAETQGEIWIEDPSRTTEELKAFNAETDIVWTSYPF